MRITAAIILLCTFAVGQSENRESTVGYLAITADADLVEIFLDGHSLGRTPFDDDLTLATGWHNVSFFGPEFKWSHWTHRQKRTIENVITAGTHNVLIHPGERTEIELEWMVLERQLKHYEQGRLVTMIIGAGMVASAMLLIAAVN